MLANKKELAEKDKKAVFMREIVTKNPVFTREQCQDFFEMFNLYCDHRRYADISDIVNTAKTLGFDKKYKIIYDALHQTAAQLKGEWIDFQTFLRLITEKVGNPFSEGGRKAMFQLINQSKKQYLNAEDLKRISEQLKFNLDDKDIQQVLNNVAGFGKKQISWDQFNKYIAKKIQKKLG